MTNLLLRFVTALLLTLQGLTAMAATPPAGAERLFHIARSLNRNVVCYDVQKAGAGLDTRHPIHVYWINHENHPGRETDISAIERKLAYGYTVKKATAQEATVTLTAYPKRPLRVCRRDGKWMAIITINGHECQLTDIYVKTKTPVTVDYIELHGKNLQGGTPQKETIKA